MKNIFFLIFFLAVGLQPACHLEKLTPEGSGDADFSVDLTDNNGYAPCKAKFQNNSSNGISFEWDFGDGSGHSTVSNPLHEYVKPGDYLVTLAISDAGGIVTSVTKPVTIRTRTFKKLIEDFNSWEVNDVTETKKGDFWVVGYGLASGTVNAAAYLMKTDFMGNRKDTMYFGQFTTGTTALEIVNDLPKYFGTRQEGFTFHPFIYGLNPPDLYTTQTIPEARFMIDAVKTTEGFYIYIANTDNQVYVNKNSGHTLPTWTALLGTGTTRATDLAPTSDGGVIIVGTYVENASSGAKLYMVKLASNGNIQWADSSYTVNEYSFWDVTQTTDGQFVVCGADKVMKFGPTGTKIWEKTFTDASNFSAIAPTLDNGIVAVGSYDGAVLLKVDENGNKVWSRIYDSGWLIHEARAIHPTSDCGFIVLVAASPAWGYVPYLIKTDAEGLVE